MKIKAALLASGILVVGAIASAVNSGCGDDDPTESQPTRRASKGEACQTTNDCSAGLACLPQSGGGGLCVLGVFSVPLTAKECAVIECKTATDCCDDPPTQCAQLKLSCEASRDAGLSEPISSCTSYDSLCVCDPAKRACESGRCVVNCVTDATCSLSGGGGKCLGGKCGQCSADDDCKSRGADFTCANGKCQAPCQGDGDCAGFDRCVEGKCIEGGCKTTRECVAATRNVEATCGTDGKCIVPCQTNLECGNPKGYSFFSCIGGQCLYMGCENDKDCRLLLGGTSSGTTSSTSTSSGTTTSTSSTSTSSSSSGGFSSKQHVVCRDKAIPNQVTRPAK